jgi:hypothetical protein
MARLMQVPTSRRPSLAFPLLLLLLPGCVQPSQPAGGGGNPPAELVRGLDNVSTEVQELARPKLVQSWVDNLIVKAQPGKDMPQVALLREGETAEYLYQRTIRKSEFVLRGQRFYEPWILIRTQAGLMGWVHEGGVRFLGEDLRDLLGNPAPQPNARSRQPEQQPAPSQDRLLVPGKKAGAITVSTSEEDLVKRFGLDQVGRGEVLTSGQQKEACTVLFPDSNDELRITWKDESRKRVKAIYLDRPRSNWRTAQGLSVGLKLTELAKINEAPLSFFGFNWEYGGTVSTWKNGTLAPFQKHFYAVLSPGRQDEALSRFSGNQVFTSNAQGLEALDIAVHRIVVYLD